MAMSVQSLLQYGFFLLILALLIKPFGGYMARVFQGQRTLLDPALRPVERVLYRVTGVDEQTEMDWKQYAVSFVLFAFCGTLLLYRILRLQRFLPWFYPAYQITPLTPELSMNTAISFSTTTTWQAYGGETTRSYFSQMAGLTAQELMA